MKTIGAKPTIGDFLGKESLKTRSGGVQVFRNNLHFLEDAEIMQKATREMFGTDLSFCITGSSKVSPFDENLANDHYQKIKYSRGPWKKTIGTYDNAIYEKAATRIQACYKGWKTRLQIRYNPDNRLGYHVISLAVENLSTEIEKISFISQNIFL